MQVNIMLTRMKKLWLVFKYLFFSEKIWRWPRQSEVLIYDTTNKEILLEYLRPWHPEVLHVRGEQTNMMVLLKSLFRGGGRVDDYIDCFVKKVRPRLVVTFIDNDSGFHSISARNSSITTLFVQNGIRDPQTFERMAGRFASGEFLKVDYMMTFGDCVGAEYSKYIQGCVISMGSMKNNHLPKLQTQQKGMMAFVSQWCPPVSPLEKYREQIYRLVLPCLVNYAEEKDKRLTIIPRNYKQCHLLNQEKSFFRDLMGSEPEFYESKEYDPSYQAVDSAEVVVSFDSTLGLESIARGNKTALFTTQSNDPYGWPGDFPAEGLFWTNHSDPASFVRILDYLFEVDDVQWRKDVENSKFSSVMAYDPGNSLLKSILEKELGAMP